MSNRYFVFRLFFYQGADLDKKHSINRMKKLHIENCIEL